MVLAGTLPKRVESVFPLNARGYCSSRSPAPLWNASPYLQTTGCKHGGEVGDTLRVCQSALLSVHRMMRMRWWRLWLCTTP